MRSTIDGHLAAELAHVEVIVEAFGGQQFVVCALLNDLPLVQDQHLIGVADGAEAVGNDETGTAV